MTKEEEEAQQQQRQRQEEVSEQTRVFAQWWIRRFEQVVKAHGLPWRPRDPIESVLGEILFEWDARPQRKTLSLYVEGETVIYLRHWDWEEKGKGGYMEEGECTWLDHALLLWQWFLA